jgi:predicted RNA-binding protein with PIN domain
MPYLIDGHNLVPHIPGLRLDADDDEQQLIELLQDFCRLSRKAVEVYFDNAPPGQARSRKYGQVHAHFIRAGRSADEAIRDRLRRLAGEARSWIVVSSDLRVQAWARQVRAQIQSSEEFSRLLRETRRGQDAERAKRPDAQLSPEEVDDWLELFQNKSQARKRGKSNNTE